MPATDCPSPLTPTGFPSGPGVLGVTRTLASSMSRTGLRRSTSERVVWSMPSSSVE